MMEIDFPDDESCPDCSCTVFRPGPRGGISQNIECANTQCGSRFNVTRWPYENRPKESPPPPIIWAQRIPSEKDGGGVWREDMFPRVLQ